MTLTWTASSGNVKVAGYRIYRDGVLVASTSKTRWSDKAVLAAGASRSYYLVAYAATGLVSPPSNEVAVP